MFCQLRFGHQGGRGGSEDVQQFEIQFAEFQILTMPRQATLLDVQVQVPGPKSTGQ